MNPAVRRQISADDNGTVYFAGPDYAAREAELIPWWKARAAQMISLAQ